MFSMNLGSDELLHNHQGLSCSTEYLLENGRREEAQILNYQFGHLPEKPPLTAMGDVIELIGHEWDPENAWNDKNKIQQSICHFCSSPIHEQFLLRIGDFFCHEQCLQCCICRENLSEKCHEKNGYFYCHFHYYSNFSQFQCSGCHLGISPNDMVYKLKTGLIYHVHCHFCFQCGKQLSPGEQIVLDDATKSISCISHTPDNAIEELQTTNISESKLPKDKQPVHELKKKHLNKKEKRLFKKDTSEFKSSSSSSSTAMLMNPIIPQYPFEMYAFGEMYSDDGRLMKRRGPRTTIKQNQLDVLNQIFSSTPKPSKHARAKLALETGLSMRVIQVWFQNRRSKERRLKHLCNFLRHYEQQGLPPPPFNINPEDGTVIPASGAFSPGCFSLDESAFIYDDDSAELSS